MKRPINKSLILNKIKVHYGFKSDAQFARFLGISPQAIASWHKRNSFDIELLYAKCKGINAAFLLSGEGVLFGEEEKEAENFSVEELIAQKIDQILAPRFAEIIKHIHEKNDLLELLKLRDYIDHKLDKLDKEKQIESFKKVN